MSGSSSARSAGPATVIRTGTPPLLEQAAGHTEDLVRFRQAGQLGRHGWDRLGVDRQVARAVKAGPEVHAEGGVELREVSSLVGAAALAAGHRPEQGGL